MATESLVALVLATFFLLVLAIYATRPRRDKTSRETLKQCADRLGVTESAAVHIAINRLYMQLFPEKIAETAPTDKLIKESTSRNVVVDKDPIVRSTSLSDLIGK